MTAPRRLTIFTEGDRTRGLGHVSRCSAYALEWKHHGGEVEWRLDGDDAACAMTLTGAVTLGAWQDAPGACAEAARGHAVIVDSYHATDAVVAAIHDHAEICVFIDDLWRTYPGGQVVHAAPDADDHPDHADAAEWLCGPAWQPLRPAFQAVPPRPEARGDIQRLLILFGGGDLRGLGPETARRLGAAFPDVRIDLVSGASAQGDLDCGRARRHEKLDAEAMARLMREADVAVSAAGQTLFELARCGTPTVMVGVADNQAANLRHWPALCGYEVAGEWNDPALFSRIETSVRRLNDPSLRQSVSTRAQAQIDGTGAARLIARLIGQTPQKEPSHA